MNALKSATVLCFTVATTLPVLAHAAEYYVDFDHPSAADNSGTNDGSEALPWKTINFGIDNAADGDTVFVKARAGRQTYREGAPVAFNTTDPQGIDAATPFRLIGIPDGVGNRPIIDGERDGGDCESGTGHTGINISDRDDIEIAGFEILNVCSLGIRTVEACNTDISDTCQDEGYEFRHKRIIVTNNLIHDVRDQDGKNTAGVRLDACDFCVVRDNVIHDIWTFTGAGADGIMAFGMSNVTIENNVIADSNSGIQFKRGPGIPSTSTVRRNLFTNLQKQALFFEVSRAGNPGHGAVILEENIIVGTNNGLRSEAQTTSSQNGPLTLNHNTIITDRQPLALKGFTEVTLTNNIIHNLGFGNANEDTHVANQASHLDYTDPTRQPSSYTAFDHNLYGLVDGDFTLNENGTGAVDPLNLNLRLNSLAEWQAYDKNLRSITQDMTAKDENSVEAEPIYNAVPFRFNDGNSLTVDPFLLTPRVNTDPNDFNLTGGSPGVGLAGGLDAKGPNVGAFPSGGTNEIGPSNRPARITDLQRL